MTRHAALLMLMVGVCGSIASGTQASQSDTIMTLMESLKFDLPVKLDVQCTDVAEGQERFLALATFKNQIPVRPGSPGFPGDFCPAGTQFFARASGTGKAIHLGEFSWNERYCALGGFTLSAEGYFEAASGDRLDWHATVRANPVPPAFPNATFVGEMTFTGGTGRFRHAAGSALLAAKQLGDAPASNVPGSTATAVCGWITSDSPSTDGNR